MSTTTENQKNLTDNSPEEDLLMMDAITLGLASPVDDATEQIAVDMDALAMLKEEKAQ